MLDNHPQKASSPFHCPNTWGRTNQPQEFWHQFPISTGWICLDKLISKILNNIHWIQKCSFANIQKISESPKKKKKKKEIWDRLKRSVSNWEPQTFRDFSNTRHTLSHKVQFIWQRGTCNMEPTGRDSWRRTRRGPSWPQPLRNEKKSQTDVFQPSLWQWQNTGAIGKKKGKKEKKKLTH